MMSHHCVLKVESSISLGFFGSSFLLSERLANHKLMMLSNKKSGSGLNKQLFPNYMQCLRRRLGPKSQT